jgi:hypothetical protein
VTNRTPCNVITRSRPKHARVPKSRQPPGLHLSLHPVCAGPPVGRCVAAADGPNPKLFVATQTAVESHSSTHTNHERHQTDHSDHWHRRSHRSRAYNVALYTFTYRTDARTAVEASALHRTRLRATHAQPQHAWRIARAQGMLVPPSTLPKPTRVRSIHAS